MTELAPYLRTKTVAERGISADQTPALAWLDYGRAAQWTNPAVQPTLKITHTHFGFPIFQASEATTELRVWRNPVLWDEPARWSTTVQYGRGRPMVPMILPWNPDWRTATTPPGTEGDFGLLVDDTIDGASGFETLGLRRPNWSEKLGLYFKTRTSFWAPVMFRDGDWIADVFVRRTPANAGRYQGRGGGMIPKRRGILTWQELKDGHIPHAIAAVGFNLNHGPGPHTPGNEPVCVAPSTRVEWAHGEPCGKTPTPTGRNPLKQIPHGQAFALNITDTQIDAWITARRYTGAKARTARTIAVGLRDYGWEFVETGCGDPQLEAGLTPAQWAIMGCPTPMDCATLLDGLIDRDTVVAVNPAS